MSTVCYVFHLTSFSRFKHVGMSEASEAVLSRRNVVKSLEPSSEVEPQEQSQAEEETDSKEVRLTLMEEILLLGLKDREVRSLSIL